MKKQLAKIYYQDREIEYIHIRYARRFEDDVVYEVSVGSATDITGKDEIVTLDYEQERDEDDAKSYSWLAWEVKDKLDKVVIEHIDAGVMINWISGNAGNIKSSLFIPMQRIQHIIVDTPKIDEDKPIRSNEIPR